MIALSEQEQKRKKKKKSIDSLKIKQIESVLLPEMIDRLVELEKEKKYVDIQVCPKCKSPLIYRVDSLGDMWAHIGITPPNYQCRECGWRQKIVLNATNKPTTIREVVIMTEAKDADNKGRKTKKGEK